MNLPPVEPVARPIRQILVVDPEPQIARLVSLLLGAGYHVDAARDLDLAIERIHATPHDAILLELVWPDSPDDAGVAALRRLRKAAPELPTVAFTASPQVAMVVAAMRSGAWATNTSWPTSRSRRVSR